MTTERCDGCTRLVAVESLEDVEVLECRQTHASPAEYSTMRLCDICRDDPRDDAFERADRIYRERTGSHL